MFRRRAWRWGEDREYEDNNREYRAEISTAKELLCYIMAVMILSSGVGKLVTSSKVKIASPSTGNGTSELDIIQRP